MSGDDAVYRRALPQLGGQTFLTDGGIETFLIFHRGLELPEFAAFDLLKDATGVEELRAYYEPYLALAAESGLGFVLESPTWRANPRWGETIGYSRDRLAEMNRAAIALMADLRDAAPAGIGPVVISGCVGPHDDGYEPESLLSADEAEAYHGTQIRTFAQTPADMVTAITMTYVEEAVGLARAAVAAAMPVAVSFTLETDGRLPSGQGLGEAIEAVDAATDRAPAYYMLNCAHPSHFDAVLSETAGWGRRIAGIRANASCKSHAELDEATELDEGDPADLAARHVALRGRLPALNVLGGCCGTDHRHVAAIRDAWLAGAHH